MPINEVQATHELAGEWQAGAGPPLIKGDFEVPPFGKGPALARQKLDNAFERKTRPALARQKMENATE
ncbi:MAG: hypothetical protein KAU38_06435 [Desulfobacterales bacterium]|nr:hypothetical protein [Desulfobacterales bacterium]